MADEKDDERGGLGDCDEDVGLGGEVGVLIGSDLMLLLLLIDIRLDLLGWVAERLVELFRIDRLSSEKPERAFLHSTPNEMK